MHVGTGFLRAFLNKLILPVGLEGDLIFTEEIVVTLGTDHYIVWFEGVSP